MKGDGSTDTKPYCICKQPYIDGQFMIECDKCNEWFHGSCIGIEEHHSQDIDIYHCPKCAEIHGPLVYSFVDVTCQDGVIRPVNVKTRRNVSRHNYKDINDGLKPISAGTVMFIRQLKARAFSSPSDIVTTFDDGTELNLSFLHQHGFCRPVMVLDKNGLDLVVPSPTFTVFDVEQHVGSMLELHVIDVARQEDLRMKMREWTEYYNAPVRGKVLNVISLEFSSTKLADLVVAPGLVRQISLVENCWPKHPPDDSPHVQPKVSKYCLMGVRDCYTDFHVDFGGTSVWYHILWGEKVFYFVEPTEENLRKYRDWVSSSDQGQVFFGDQVRKCYKVTVSAGNTLFIPTGWIHAVYTPKDSLVFGGNFLHCFSMEKQNKIYQLEKELKTPLKFLFPNYETTMWYAAKAILRKVKDLHAAGVKMPLFLQIGLQDLVTFMKQWVGKKGELVKYHLLQVPVEINATKLVKSLEKELSIDLKMDPACEFRFGTCSSPAVFADGDVKQVIKLKIAKVEPHALTVNSFGMERGSMSSPNGCAQAHSSSSVEELERKERKLKHRKKLLKQGISSKRILPMKLSIGSGQLATTPGNVRKVTDKAASRLSGNRLRQADSKSARATSGGSEDFPLKRESGDGEIVVDDDVVDDVESDTTSIRLKLPLTSATRTGLVSTSDLNGTSSAQKLERSAVRQLSGASGAACDRDVASTGLMELAMQAERSTTSNAIRGRHQVATGSKLTSPSIRSERDSAKSELFLGAEEDKDLSPQGRSKDMSLVRPFQAQSTKAVGRSGLPRNDATNLSVKNDDAGLLCVDGDDNGDDDGYVIDHIPKPKGAPVKKREHSETDSDYDPSEDAYYQDANFVYPRIDMTSELDEDDYSWKPGQRKRHRKSGRKGSQNLSKLNSDVSSAALREDFDPFFAPDKDNSKSADLSSRSASHLSRNGGNGQPDGDDSKVQTSAASAKFQVANNNKPKKGLATAKQRLGKLLKLDKTGSRYVR